MKTSVVKEALRMLRSQGIRIPRHFSQRLDKRHGYVPKRGDMKAFKEALANIEDGERIVVGVGKSGLVFSTYSQYSSRVKTAEHARSFHTAKNGSEENPNS